MVSVKKYGVQSAGCETDSVRRYGGIQEMRCSLQVKETVCGYGERGGVHLLDLKETMCS